METGLCGMIGFAPIVKTTERKLLSQIPDAEQEPFLRWLGSRVQHTRSGEPVFAVSEYETWKATA